MHLTISVAVSLRDFYCSLSHGAASVWVFGFGATDSLCPFAISLARHLLSLSRSRFPHWCHVISSGVWMWQENDSVLGSRFSVLSLFMHFQRAQRSNSRHPLVCPTFPSIFFFLFTFVLFLPLLASAFGPTTYFIRSRWCKRLPSCWHVAAAKGGI